MQDNLSSSFSVQANNSGDQRLKLGRLVSSHRGNFLGHALAAVALIPAGCFLGNPANLKTDPLFFCMGVGLLVIGVVLLATAFGRYSYYANCYENGLELKLRGAERILFWNEIKSVRQESNELRTRVYWGLSVHTASSETYFLELNDGSRLEIPDFFQGIEPLGRYMQEKVARQALDRLLAEFEAGQTVSFGPLKFDKRGVAVGAKFVSWEEVLALDLSNGLFRVRYSKPTIVEKVLGDGTLTIPHNALSNYMALPAFVQSLPSLLQGRWPQR